MKNSQQGFSAVVILLLIVLVAIIGGTGYYIWHSQQQVDRTYSQTANSSVAPQAKNTTKTATQPSADSYSGWKSYTTQFAKVNFEYPPTWKLQDNSINGQDIVELTGDNGFTFNLEFSDIGHPSLDYKPKVLYSQQALFNGKFDGNGQYSFNNTQEFLDYIGGAPAHASNGLVYSANLSKNSTDALDTPTFGKYGVSIHGQTASPESLAAAKADTNYKNAYLVISTLNKAH